MAKKQKPSGVKPIHRMGPKEIAAVKKEIVKIELAGDEPSPARIVEIARDPANVMHPYFTWDDARAGYRYRLHQARQLIGMVRVSIQSVPQKVREWVGWTRARHGTCAARWCARNLTMQAERSERLWRVAESAAREAMSIGLHEKDPKWAALCEVVFASTSSA